MLTQKTNKKNHVAFIFGLLLVWLCGYLTMSSSSPKPYSPYSLPATIPALIFSIGTSSKFILAIFSSGILTLIFSIWYFIVARGNVKVPKLSFFLTVILIIFSFVYISSHWAGGVKYQGVQHVVAVSIYNLSFWVLLFYILKRNFINPTYESNWAFHTCLFCWLAWTAFPWLGPTI